LNEGDQIVVNDPYHGGSHFSDIAYKAGILLSIEAVHQFKIEREKVK
jgi:hypothetical protein